MRRLALLPGVLEAIFSTQFRPECLDLVKGRLEISISMAAPDYQPYLHHRYEMRSALMTHIYELHNL